VKLKLSDLSNYPLNQAVLFQALICRGVSLDLVESTHLIIGEYLGKKFTFLNGFSHLIPHGTGIVLNNKDFTRQVLQHAGLPISPGKSFIKTDMRLGLFFAKKIGWPLLLRVENANLHVKAILNIRNPSKFIIGWSFLAKYGENILVEQMQHGIKIRIFYHSNGYWQALHIKEKIPHKRGISHESDLRNIYLTGLGALPDWDYISNVNQNQQIKPKFDII